MTPSPTLGDDSTAPPSIKDGKPPSSKAAANGEDTHISHAHPLAQLSQTKKNVLLLVFSVATFLDICNVSGAGLAVPQISRDIGLESSQIPWIITAYSLTFAAFLLFAGRLADLFPATIIFELGFTGLGVLSLITSFVTNSKYGFLILRGLGGLFGALTIPSSYHLLVHMFPEPQEQQKKMALLGMAGGIGNVMGMVLAGLTMLASYHWFFRLIAILCLVFSTLGFLLLPRIAAPLQDDPLPRWRRLDLPGVIFMMGFLICFILSLTQGPIDGWSSAAFIAPFIISFISAILFFVWEWRIPPRTAILPSTVWKIRNFLVSSLVIMVPLGFYFTSQLLFATYFQIAYGWTPIHVAATIVPQGIVGLILGASTQFFPVIITKPRISLPLGVVGIIVGTILQIYSYGGQGYDYWRFVFPGFITGAMVVYFASVINIISYAPPEMSGVISAWTQVVAQVGGAVTLAIMAAFEKDLFVSWMNSAGRIFWFVVAWSAALGLQYALFYRTPGTPEEEHEKTRKLIRESGKELGVVETAV